MVAEAPPTEAVREKVAYILSELEALEALMAKDGKVARPEMEAAEVVVPMATPAEPSVAATARVTWVPARPKRHCLAEESRSSTSRGAWARDGARPETASKVEPTKEMVLTVQA